jgi:uncharacterized membrane protein
MLTYPGPMGGDSAVGLIVEAVRRQLEASGGWMAWNLILALTPWVLAVGLFRPSRRPRWEWFVLAAGWLILIPNAAYVLTDVVHLPAAVRREPSDRLVMLVVFPLYATFFAVGFVAYSDALRRLSRHVTHLGWVRRGWTVEVAVHAASAIAIYLGRIHRLNSWDLAREPLAVAGRIAVGATRPAAVAGIAVMFVALAAGQTLTRPILDAAAARAAGVAARLRA